MKEKVKSEGPQCVFTKCQQLHCNVQVPHSKFMEFLKGQINQEENYEYLEKYKQWHCKQFTDHNPNVKWCPQTNCNLLIEQSEYALDPMIDCPCGKRFCFRCGNEDHSPATCEDTKAWLKQENADSANLNWLRLNTK